MSAKRAWRRLFVLTPQKDQATKWVFKRFVELAWDLAKNLETYLPGLPKPNDGISDQAFGAYFGSWFVQLQIGSTEIGHGKGEPCAMRHLAKQAEYSRRHFFRIQAACAQEGHVDSDHDAQGLPAKRKLTSKFLADIKPLLQKHLGTVPKEVKDQERIERWINQLIQKGRDYLAAKARSQARAEEKPPADQATGEAAMRTIHDILAKHRIPGGRGGGDPAPAV